MERQYHYLKLSEQIPGGARGDEAKALFLHAFQAPANAVIVEIGAYLGSNTILLAGARKLQRSGVVHSFRAASGSADTATGPSDPDGGVGTAVNSPPASILDTLLRAGVQRWVSALTGDLLERASSWPSPIDLLYVDADKSPEDTEHTLEVWSPHLRIGAIVALRNSNDRQFAAVSERCFGVIQDQENGPRFEQVEQVGATKYWRKLS